MQIARKVLLIFFVASCALFEPQSKIKSGQLFQSGQTQYDDYFTKVHNLQVESAGWPDDKKAALRSLIDALKIATDAADVTILEATHEHMVSIAHVVGATHLDLHEDDGKVTLASESRADASTKEFVKALQATVDGEMKRKRELRDVPNRCDELAKVGRELEPRVKQDFFRSGGTMMADVHDEIDASFDVLEQISKTSRLERRETEDFIGELGRAVVAEPAEYGRPEGVPPPSTTGRPPPVQTSHPRPPPVANNPPPVATSKPKPPQPKPQGGGDEVFNP
ncbi:MAG TPA: hypothetical protein VGH87_18560 [Polyangiaceae bacterium]|jgi:hypothetical protein